MALQMERPDCQNVYFEESISLQPTKSIKNLLCENLVFFVSSRYFFLPKRHKSFTKCNLFKNL
jgi:hypothetical protein